MTQTSGIQGFTDYGEFSRPAVIAVGVPLMIAAGIATYFNSRASIAQRSPEAAANPQTAMMNKLALYVFPLGVVVGGPFLPLEIIIYWFSNNVWTFGQQHYVFGMIEKQEEAKKREVLERRAANAPAPGAKPKRPARGAPPGGDGASTTVDDQTSDAKASQTTPASPVSRRRMAVRPAHPTPGGKAEEAQTVSRQSIAERVGGCAD